MQRTVIIGLAGILAAGCESGTSSGGPGAPGGPVCSEDGRLCATLTLDASEGAAPLATAARLDLRGGQPPYAVRWSLDGAALAVGVQPEILWSADLGTAMVSAPVALEGRVWVLRGGVGSFQLVEVGAGGVGETRPLPGATQSYGGLVDADGLVGAFVKPGGGCPPCGLMRLDAQGAALGEVAGAPQPATGPMHVAWDGSALWTGTLGGVLTRVPLAGTPETVHIEEATATTPVQGLTWNGRAFFAGTVGPIWMAEVSREGRALRTFASPGGMAGAPTGMAWSDGTLHVLTKRPEGSGLRSTVHGLRVPPDEVYAGEAVIATDRVGDHRVEVTARDAAGRVVTASAAVRALCAAGSRSCLDARTIGVCDDAGHYQPESTCGAGEVCGAGRCAAPRPSCTLSCRGGSSPSYTWSCSTGSRSCTYQRNSLGQVIRMTCRDGATTITCNLTWNGLGQASGSCNAGTESCRF